MNIFSPTHSIASTSYEEQTTSTTNGPIQNPPTPQATTIASPAPAEIRSLPSPPPATPVVVNQMPPVQTQQNSVASSTCSASPTNHDSSSFDADVMIPTNTVINEAKEKLKQEKKEKHATKKLMKDLAVCKTLLGEMEVNLFSVCYFLSVILLMNCVFKFSSYTRTLGHLYYL